MSAPLPESACALADGVRAGRWRARELVERSLARIERANPRLHAVRWVDAEGARARADALDRAQAKGADPGPLAGVPVALKANLCFEGWPCDCGSRILAGWRAPYTATALERLLAAGAIPLATTQMDEFAMGSSGENTPFEPARNPWDVERAPGGSSSGSAVSVAAGLVPLALGSDTGGSVRQPAALCGISGFKPTYGRISRHGLIAFGSSLDQISPFARDAEDLERVFGVLAGPDPRDATSLAAPFVPAAPEPPAAQLARTRFGYAPRALASPGVEPEVRAGVEAALAHLEAHGARIVEVDLPLTENALPAYYVVSAAEAASNLARFDGVRYGLREPVPAGHGDSLGELIARTRDAGFGREVKRRILLGTFVLSSGYHEAWYGRAQRARRALVGELEGAFQAVDLLVGPTSPSLAFRFGEHMHDPLSMYLADVMTVPASLAGLPAISVPCGTGERDGRRLPIGLQLSGPRGADALVLAVARAFQATSAHHAARPDLALEVA